MADDATQTPADNEPQDQAQEQQQTDEQRVPYERFQQANRKAKEAADRAKTLEQQMNDLRQQMEERENAGLPELDRMRKDLERAQKRAEEAEQRAQQQEQAADRSRRERLVAAAAQAAKFHDPDDAARYVDLDDIESPADAERAVKRVAKSKKHLVREDSPQLPGRVLTNGQRVNSDDPHAQRVASEADTIGAALSEFLKQRQQSDIQF